jgi:5-(carboxyamino)imidazole ribonucleotide synthase
MFCMAAQSLGYKVCVLDPDPDSPAGAIADQHLCRGYLDVEALQELAARVRAVSTEFENVPAATLNLLSRQVPVSPDSASVAIAQDRLVEKRFATDCGLAVVPHAAIAREVDLVDLDPRLLPGILKSAQLGYDGKGQVGVTTPDEVRAAWQTLRGVPCVLEQRVLLRQELSVVVCRGRDGAVAAFPVAENEHVNGILARTTVPARIDAATADRARDAAVRIATRMNYVGVLCVELFLLHDRRLLVNELAPRPHNSGHWSIDAAVTSQFEQQARIMAGLPLGETRALSPAVMLNLLGDLWFSAGHPRVPAWDAALAQRGVKLHLYGKREPRPGRKMGHLTVLGDTLVEAHEQAQQAAAVLDLPLPPG